MKTKFLSLAVALSCTTAYAAPALPSSSGDLRALEQNRATQGEAGSRNQRRSGNNCWQAPKNSIWSNLFFPAPMS